MSQANQVEQPVGPHVTRIQITYSQPRSKPKAGDRRTTKTYGVQIRVQRMARDWRGNPIGRIVRNGKPCYDWRTPRQLDPWDHHWLTEEERAALNATSAA